MTFVVNWQVVKQVRYRHVVSCHRDSQDDVLNPEPWIAHPPIDSVYLGVNTAEERYSFRTYAGDDRYGCMVIRHRLYLTYVLRTGQEHSFELAHDFARYQ